MATLDNAALVREMYQAWNDKDLDRMASYATADARMTNVPLGKKLGFREDGEAWARAFPDGQIEVTNLVAQGEWVAVEFTGRGTHTGALGGPAGDVPPTGRRIELQVVEFHRLRSGKIVESRIYFDAAGLMNQLGLGMGMPAAQASAGAKPQPRH